MAEISVRRPKNSPKGRTRGRITEQKFCTQGRRGNKYCIYLLPSVLRAGNLTTDSLRPNGTMPRIAFPEREGRVG